MDFATMTSEEIMNAVASGKLTKAQMQEAFSIMASVASAAQAQVRELEERQKQPKGKRALEKQAREEAVSFLITQLSAGNYFGSNKDIGETISWLTGHDKPVAYATVKSLFKEQGLNIHVRPVFIKTV